MCSGKMSTFSRTSNLPRSRPVALVRNLAAQKLTRLEFIVPAEILQRGDNRIVLSVDRKGPFSPSQYVKVEKVELHLK